MGGDRYAWGSVQIIGLGVAAAVLLLALVWQERRAAEPILPLGLFGDPVFVVVSAGLFIATLSLFAAIVFLPLFLQLVTGASATQSGLLTLPLLLASALSTIVSGRVMAATGRYKIFPVVGLALMGLGLLLFSTLEASTSNLSAAAYMVVFGLGFGMVTQSLDGRYPECRRPPGHRNRNRIGQPLSRARRLRRRRDVRCHLHQRATILAASAPIRPPPSRGQPAWYPGQSRENSHAHARRSA
jgi:Major Facilitator Superfamily